MVDIKVCMYKTGAFYYSYMKDSFTPSLKPTVAKKIHYSGNMIDLANVLFNKFDIDVRDALNKSYERIQIETEEVVKSDKFKITPYAGKTWCGSVFTERKNGTHYWKDVMWSHYKGARIWAFYNLLPEGEEIDIELFPSVVSDSVTIFERLTA